MRSLLTSPVLIALLLNLTHAISEPKGSQLVSVSIHARTEGPYVPVGADEANMILINSLAFRDLRLVAGGFLIGVLLASLFFALTMRIWPSSRISNGMKQIDDGRGIDEASKAQQFATEAPPESAPMGLATSIEHEYDESLDSFWPRTIVLIIMLMVQSLSSYILFLFRGLVIEYPELIFFLTMLVGLGGNVSGQSVVLAVRELALGRDVKLERQALFGIGIGMVLAPIAYFRAYLADGRDEDLSMVIAVSVVFIAMAGTFLGTTMPKLFDALGVDPGHTSPVVQVLMDMVGITIVCTVGYVLLDRAHGKTGLGK